MLTTGKPRTNGTVLQVQAPERQSTWHFITNQLNLMYMLAAGMIMPPRAFGKKYYEDSLSTAPGWIPFFPGAVPRAMQDMAARESTSLRPVIVAMDLSCLEGPAKAARMNGGIRDIQLPDDLAAVHSVLFVPAPLPTRFIEAIYFLSQEDKTATDRDALDYANVPLGSFKRFVKKRPFGGGGQVDWSIHDNFPETNNIPMDTFLAAGGMMAMLLHCANMGDFSVLACQTAFDGVSEDSRSRLSGTVIQGLDYWMHHGAKPDSTSVSNDLFWGVVDKLVQVDKDGTSQPAFKNIILGFLTQFKAQSDVKYRKTLSDLISDLTELDRFGAKNTTELLESHPKDVRRGLILFFLRNRCEDLIDFSHPLLTERDYIAAALLFAVREKWIGLPLSLRDYPGLNLAVSHRMAAMAHQVMQSGINLGVPPPRCRPLRELLSAGAGGWTKKQANAALCLARDLKWPCVSTKIRIGRGEYRLTIDGGGVNIFFPGEIRAVETEVDKEKFFEIMAEQCFIDTKSEKKARKYLAK